MKDKEKEIKGNIAKNLGDLSVETSSERDVSQPCQKSDQALEIDESAYEMRISELEKELSDTKEKLLRTLADVDNSRKRYYKELLEAKNMARFDTLIPFLKVYDHFQLAVKAADEKHNFDVLYQGMEMILSEFSRAFEELGIEKIDAVGKKFDPYFHEAAEEKNSDAIPEGHVMEQWRCGYKIGDKILQPATVIVSSGPEKQIKKKSAPSSGKPIDSDESSTGEKV